MTQSGQGEEPSARPAREGIVLPSDGSAPLLPGTTGERPAPAGGQAWGGAWGPDRSEPAPPPAQGWGADAAQQWGPAPSAGPAPTPDWGARGGAQLPPESASSSAGSAQAPAGGAHGSAGGAYSAPMPPPAHPGGAQPYPSSAGAGFPAAPLPSADEGATQYIPPVVPGHGPGPDEGATQYLPPVTAPFDEGATQYIPPVGPGAMPPAAADESTRTLGRTPRHGSAPGAGPMPPAAGAGPLPPATDPDAQPTQYIPPVPGGEAPHHPPAEFDNLFRTEGVAPSTQQMPRVEPAAAPPGGRAARRGGRTGSRVPLVAAVGVGIAVLGIGAGALLSGGGSNDDSSKNVSETAPATAGSSSPAADPAKEQAVALDALLAESGDSRQSVVTAVANVRACKNLDASATDLRNAAQQRNDLVKKLSALSVDKLPDHDRLTAALTAAWQASASADNHYAAWADQAKSRKVCKKGQARGTSQTVAGNTASGTATVQKKKAAPLWNTIAGQYGLTQRQPTQL